MSKEDLLKDIAAIPLFEFRKVAIGYTFDQIVNEDGAVVNPDGDGVDYHPGDTKANGTVQEEEWKRDLEHRAIVEVGSRAPLVFVSNRYKLVQFAEMFKPIVESVESCEGQVVYNEGFAIMSVMPDGEDFAIDGGRVGIVAYNSVDATSGLVIRFVVKNAGKEIVLPKKLSYYRKVHKGNAGQVTHDYVAMLGKVKEAWTDIVTRFSSTVLSKEELANFAVQLELGEDATKKLRYELGLAEQNNRKIDLWTACMMMFDFIAAKSYKSDIHKRKHLDALCDAMFKYRFALRV
jgi:hypothetical protein